MEEENEWKIVKTQQKPTYVSLIERENQIQTTTLLRMVEAGNWNSRALYDYLNIIYTYMAELKRITIKGWTEERCYIWNTKLTHRKTNEWIYCMVIPAMRKDTRKITRMNAVTKYMIYFVEENKILKSKEYVADLKKAIATQQSRSPVFGLKEKDAEEIPLVTEKLKVSCGLEEENIRACMLCTEIPIRMEDIEELPFPPSLSNYREDVVRTQMKEAITKSIEEARKDTRRAMMAYDLPTKINHEKYQSLIKGTQYSLLIDIVLPIAVNQEEHIAIRIRYEPPTLGCTLGRYRIVNIVSLEEAYLAVRVVSKPPKGSWLRQRLGMAAQSPPSPTSSMGGTESIISSSLSYQQSTSSFSCLTDMDTTISGSMSHVNKMKNEMKRSRSQSYSGSMQSNSHLLPPPHVLEAQQTFEVVEEEPNETWTLKTSEPNLKEQQPNDLLTHLFKQSQSAATAQQQQQQQPQQQPQQPQIFDDKYIRSIREKRQRSRSMHSPLVNRYEPPPPVFMSNTDVVQAIDEGNESLSPTSKHISPRSSATHLSPHSNTTSPPQNMVMQIPSDFYANGFNSPASRSLTHDQLVCVNSTKSIPHDDPIWQYKKWQLLEMYQKVHKDYPESPELDETCLIEEVVYHILNSNWKWKCELCCRYKASDPKRSHCRFRKTPWKCYFAHGNDDLRKKEKFF